MTVPIPTGVSGQPVDMTTADDTFSVVSRSAVVALPLLALADAEVELVNRLAAQVLTQRFELELHNAYYDGVFRIQDLGISIPPQLRNVRVVLGWPRIAVDHLNARLDLQGFRRPDSRDLDQDLMDIYLGNRLDSEAKMANLDALVFGHAYGAVGTNPDNPDLPLVTIESPLDIAVEWDARTRRMVAAFRLFGYEGARLGTLYLPDETVSLEQGQGGWAVVERDRHNLGEVLLERIVNRPRSYDRDGASEITPELMSITDAACRTLLGLEVAREFYSAPQRYILGADESAFQDAQGNPKSAWETYLGRVLAIERNPEGDPVQVGQFTPYDPAVFTKVIDMYARIVSSLTGLPPHVLGYTTDNPASADAIRSTENSLVVRAKDKARTFGADWQSLMRKALLVRGGAAPDFSITAAWGDPATPTPAATTDAIYKQVQMGYLPATSDVTGEKLGYSPAERARIDTDRESDQGVAFLNEVAHSLGAKDARADKSLAGDITGTHSNPNPPPVSSGDG